MRGRSLRGYARLSIRLFVFGKYFRLVGPKNLDDLIELPENEYRILERLRVFYRCELGINDLITRIWPILGRDAEVDYLRIIKFFLMDLLWVFSGEMDNNLETVKTKLLKSPNSSELMTMQSEISNIFSLFNRAIPLNDLGVVLFENLIGIQHKIYRIEAELYSDRLNEE